MQSDQNVRSLQARANTLTTMKDSLQSDLKQLHHQIADLSHKSGMNDVCACKSKPKRSVHRQQQIPEWISDNQALREAIARGLPSNYNFEIAKTIWRLSQCEPKCCRVALQFPEGLLMYACIISDILEQFAEVECCIMADVAYGACCIDDYTCKALQCDFLVHYGHSCLVPISQLCDEYYQRVLYVFVEIAINTQHFIASMKHNFDPLRHYKDKRIVIAGTVQFTHMLAGIKQSLCDEHGYRDDHILIPQAKPLSPAEVLGCTSPDLRQAYGDDTDIECVVFVADGRFHLESLMIANPHISQKGGFFRYNPYDCKFTKEAYNTALMHTMRQQAIESAKRKYDAVWCVILSTLGRQGNVGILRRLCSMLKAKRIRYVTVLMSEIYGDKLAQFDLTAVQCFVQIGCPRLSIDWGTDVLSEQMGGTRAPPPLLNAYEATVALQQVEWRSVYPMDYYKSDGGVWSNYYMTDAEKRDKERQRKEKRKLLRKQRLLQKNKSDHHIAMQYQ
mmetsp:Transcript_12321/g.18579  ORF Transcript_12321/g.18579 Transcript_12321/m.18579 type:complete len:504 (+) Transcript_12321:59-1570(+)